MNIDELFIKNSAWVWNNLREARKLNMQLNEETITDFLLLNLQKQAGNKLKIRSYNRHEEARNGADWAWWFTGPSGKWLGMRVQAKILNFATEKYQSIDYKNSRGQQIDLLVNDAKLHNMIPIYCMYSNWDPNKYSTPQNCLTHTSFVRHYVAALLSIRSVEKFKVNKIKHLSKIIFDLIPLHCLVCSSHYKGLDLPSIVLEHVKTNGLLFTDQIEYVLQDKPPHYVEQILNNENMTTIDADERLKIITIFQEIRRID